MERLLPTLPATPAERLPAETLPPSGAPRGTVAVLEGCVQSLLFPEVNRATVRLLARAGYRVVVPAEQGCCGALHLHWGDRHAGAGAGPAERRRPSRTPTGSSRTPAGCGATLRDYGHLLGDDPGAARWPARVRDVTELLAEHLPEPRQPLDLTVTYHEPCHLAHGQRVREAPRAILRRDPGAAAGRSPRVGPLLRVGRRLQPDGARDRRASSSSGSSTGSRARAPAWWRAGTRAASSSSAGGWPTAASRCGPIIRWSSWRGRSRGPRPRRGAEAWEQTATSAPTPERLQVESQGHAPRRWWHGHRGSGRAGRWPKRRSATSRSARSRH